MILYLAFEVQMTSILFKFFSKDGDGTLGLGLVSSV